MTPDEFLTRFLRVSRGLRTHRIAAILNSIRPVTTCPPDWRGCSRTYMEEQIPVCFTVEEQELILQRIEKANAR